MKANKTVTKNKVNKSDEHGYWMYSNGFSYWGIGLYKVKADAPIKPNENGTQFELPIKIDTSEPEKIHKGTIEEKIEWYQVKTGVKKVEDKEEKTETKKVIEVIEETS